MAAQDLANRVGISRTTLYNIEKGEPGPEIGIVFEAAALAGVRPRTVNRAAQQDDPA